jgi:hypothetical protein
MAGTLLGLQGVLPSLESGGVAFEVGWVLAGLGIGIGVFVGVAAFLGSDEIQVLRSLFQRWRT